MGSVYFNQEKNIAKAFKYFKLAAASGKCASALNNLGYCFEVGSHMFDAENNTYHK